MKFSGRLHIESDPPEWLKTDLTLAHGRVELTSAGEVLGSWATTQVKAERIDGDRFELHLGDDRALFAADDALAFSYEALPHLTKKHVLAGPVGLRSRWRNGFRHQERAEAQVPAATDHGAVRTESRVATIAEPEPVHEEMAAPDHPVAHRLRELIQAATEERLRQEQAEAEAARAEEDQWSSHHSDIATIEEAEPLAFQESNEVILEADDFETEDIFETVPFEPLPAYEVEAIVSEAAMPIPPAPLPPLAPRPTLPITERLDFEPAFAKAPGGREDEPSARVMTALEGVLTEVRKGTMTPAQVSAVTGLVEAVTELVETRRS
jgi:hypothetical protein